MNNSFTNLILASYRHVRHPDGCILPRAMHAFWLNGARLWRTLKKPDIARVNLANARNVRGSFISNL